MHHGYLMATKKIHDSQNPKMILNEEKHKGGGKEVICSSRFSKRSRKEDPST
jgi:hypothetical protein